MGKLSATSFLHPRLPPPDPARLAVEPRLQNQHIGSALIRDLFLYSLENDIHEVTVNTQSDNQASLALYTKLGFSITGEKYPVFTYHLS